MSQLFIILALFFSTIIDGQIILDEPVDYQISSLDDLWDKLNNDPDWKEWGDCPDVLPSPWMNLRMAGEIFKGKPEEFDNQAFVILSLQFLDYKNFGICRGNNTTIFYGDGLRDFLTWFKDPQAYYDSGAYDALVRRALKVE